MRKLVSPIAAVLVAFLCVAPAQAEKWMWFPIRGGAVAYDVDSRKEDKDKGVVGADTVIYYDQARTVPEGEFNFVAERLEFECRNDRQRWQRSAVLDRQGRIVLSRPDGDWEAMPKEMGSAALFSRMLCMSQDPPGGKQAKDLSSLIAAMREGSAGMTALADLAFPAPKVITPARNTPVAALRPAPAAPPAAAPTLVPAPAPASSAAARPASSDPIGSVIAARPATVPETKVVEAAPAPAIATVSAVAAARGMGPTIAAPAGTTPYPAADRCLIMKVGVDPRYFFAFNDCSYRVNYAWCVTNAEYRNSECGGPTIARGAGAVAARTNALSTYSGGMGRLYMFGCRAPGTPVVKLVGGKPTHECFGPEPATTTAAAEPKLRPTPKLQLPKLRGAEP